MYILVTSCSLLGSSLNLSTLEDLSPVYNLLLKSPFSFSRPAFIEASWASKPFNLFKISSLAGLEDKLFHVNEAVLFLSL